MTTSKPLASLSLDLDNKWSYLKTRGDRAWQSLPSYLDLVVPRVLELLKTLDLTITVFVVGQDAALAVHREPLAAIAGTRSATTPSTTSRGCTGTGRRRSSRSSSGRRRASSAPRDAGRWDSGGRGSACRR